MISHFQVNFLEPPNRTITEPQKVNQTVGLIHSGVRKSLTLEFPSSLRTGSAQLRKKI